MAFLDKITKGISKGVSTASVRAKEALDLNRVKSEITSLHEQRRVAIEALGTLVYKTMVSKSFDKDVVRAKAIEIATMDGQIRDREKQMDRIRQQSAVALGKGPSGTVCACGELVPAGSTYCPTCGSDVP